MAKIQTPDEQLEVVLSTPGLTANQIERAKNWAINEKKRRETFGMEWVKEARARNEARAKQVAADLYEVRNAYNDLKKRASRGEYESLNDLFRETDRLRVQIDHDERAIEAMQSTEELADLVAGDPVAYFTSFYSRFSSLADRVPTISEALYD